MSRELKKFAVFGIIIAALTSSYVTFLGTGLRQGFFSEGFWANWLSLIPKAYLVVLPFVLLTGPIVRKLVDKIFGDKQSDLEAGSKKRQF